MSRTTFFERFAGGLSHRLGQLAAVLVMLMIAVGAYNASVRYLGRFIGFNLSSNAYLELQWALFSAAFLFGGAETLRRDAHVRVDVIYGRLSEKARSWIDFVGSITFLLPFAVFGLLISLPMVRSSWQILEGSPDPGGLPRYPIKTLIPIGFAALAIQGVAQAILSWRRLRTRTEPEGEA